MKQVYLILSVFMMALFSACQHYYKARNIQPENASRQLDSLRNQGRYFVFHGSGRPLYMKNLSVVNDQNMLRFETDTLSMQHKLHLTKGRNAKFRYKQNDMLDSAVIREVHIYAPTAEALPGQAVSVAMQQVQKIEVLEVDKERTRSSQIWGAIGYTVGTVAVGLGIAAALIASSWNWK